MPPGKHTPKEKRQAAHIAKGYQEKGMSKDKAVGIGYATVNDQKSSKKSTSRKK